MNNVVLFEQNQVRRVWNEADQKWYFAVQDVIEILTGSADIKQYVKKLKSRDPELNSNWGTICTLVEMTAADGKKVAGNTRKELERKSGRKVTTKENYIEIPEKQRRLRKKNTEEP